MPDRLIVWIISDGKPGHVNQSLGLAEALAHDPAPYSWAVTLERRWTDGS